MHFYIMLYTVYNLVPQFFWFHLRTFYFFIFISFFLVYGIKIRWLIDCIMNSHFNFRDILLEVKMLRRRINNICQPIDLLLLNYYFKNLSTQTNRGSSIGQDNPHIHIAHYQLW